MNINPKVGAVLPISPPKTLEYHFGPDIKVTESIAGNLRHGPTKFSDPTGKLLHVIFYIRGQYVTEELWRLALSNRLTAKIICEINHARMRIACLEHLGYSHFIAQMPHQVIDQNGPQCLIKICNWHKDEEDLCCVKVRCPSTGSFYALRVPPQTLTVKEAVAWTFSLPSHEYNPIQET